MPELEAISTWMGYKAMRQDEIKMSVTEKNQGPRIEPGVTPIIRDKGEEEEIE